MPTIEITPARVEDKEIVQRLLELYIHDLSAFMDINVDEHGAFGYPTFEQYWTEPERAPFLIRADGNLAGFALVRSGSPHDMAEFFVLRHYRRDGIGQYAARDVINRFPGEWQVRQMATNTAATAFWRTAIPVPYREETLNGGPVQRFKIDPGSSGGVRV